MKKFILPLYYAFISFLFTLESIIYINDAGDQTSFAHMAQKYGFFEFAIYRYKTWSSRLLIESVTMFMSNHYLLFDVTVLISVAIFFYCFNGIFLREEKYRKLQFVSPVIFLLSFPSLFFTSAGLIATVTNYLFPMISFVIAWYCIIQEKHWYTILSLPFLVFACMQEQFTVYAFILFVFALISSYLECKRINKNYFIATCVSLLGLVSGLLCPGSANRLTTETKIWYPGFETISFPVKIIKGYLETNRVLFVTSELNIVYLLLVLIIVVSIMKKQYFATFVSGTVIYTVITQRLGMNSLLTAVQRTIDNQNKSEIPNYFSLKENLYPIVLYTLILCIVAVVVFMIFKEWKGGLTALVVLAAGYASRMTVSLSPTIYASGLRTYTPLIFSFVIVILLLSKEISGIVIEKDLDSDNIKNSMSI
ncbi:hypothetical protein [Streptococcus infantarius]|uniref:hypothetical protein n=1 Tax=Streptococcus infantarius TaxID=102684 RepID=UPI001BDB232E|nr:hypothetical protein [Streptococcus infantarius]MBT0896300.1 hypothetical protein [Streptococcus infantarius subsp. infantarius]MBT0900562.1 hypothetical protein [Streptococcus infantarius subsp. infantarius]MBT0931980.1 hypothetical protein [Streptococcus infantarius subsp. infantarius]MBT1034276.1 hypothetical protein [Streptococcus infantarius subsp. infantarius]